MRFLFVLLLAVSAFSDFSGIKKFLTKDGFSNIHRLANVPDNVQGSLICVAMLDTEGKVLTSNSGELIGRIYDDYADIGDSKYVILCAVSATKEGSPYTIIMGPQIMILFTSAGDDMGQYGRYIMQVVMLANGKSIKALIK